jgi:hypothetical protein
MKDVEITINKNDEQTPKSKCKSNIDDDDSKSSLDTEREEEKWNNKNEHYLETIRDSCLAKSKAHNLASHKNKKRFIYTSIPAVVLPFALANASLFLPSSLTAVEPIGLTLVGIINGLQTLLNFSKKTETHNIYAGKFSQLASDITTQLTRGKRFRVALDVYLERVTTRLRDLDENAPML